MQPEELEQVEPERTCCLNCKYFEMRTCFCRFNPPVPMTVNIGGIQVTTSNYPKITLPNIDWCGKFENENEDVSE